MSARLALCDLGAPGWGILFPHSAVLTPGCGDVCHSVLPLFSCHTNTSDDTMMPRYCYYITGPPVTFPFGLFLCCVFWLVLLAYFFGLVVFFSFGFETEL